MARFYLLQTLPTLQAPAFVRKNEHQISDGPEGPVGRINPQSRGKGLPNTNRTAARLSTTLVIGQLGNLVRDSVSREAAEKVRT